MNETTDLCKWPECHCTKRSDCTAKRYDEPQEKDEEEYYDDEGDEDDEEETYDDDEEDDYDEDDPPTLRPTGFDDPPGLR